MKIAVVVSSAEIADMNIKKQLVERFGFRETERDFDGFKVLSNGKFELYTLKEKSIYSERCDEIPADVLVFGSSHRSESERPTLTVHCVGNFGKAEMGGKDREIVRGSAVLVRKYLRKLQEIKERDGLEYEVGLEVTHHGPYTGKALVYVELGSTEKQWKDEKAARAVAETVVSVEEVGGSGETIAVALGGGHYAPEFSKLLLRTDYAIAHICPKWALGDFDNEMFRKMIGGTLEEVGVVVLDWKGLGEHKPKVKGIVEGSGLEIKKVRKLL